MLTRSHGLHTALLCPMTGTGVLVSPDPAIDVLDPQGSPLTLHQCDYDSALDTLRRDGWVHLEDSWGLPYIDGRTATGAVVMALYYEGEPIVSEPTAEQLAAAQRELHALAGVVPALAR